MKESNTYKLKVCDLVKKEASAIIFERLDLVKRHAEISAKLKDHGISHRDFMAMTEEANALSREIEILHAKEDVFNYVLKICTEIKE